jgi:pimeloyl-ACP methyl ester carboxylesterase
MDTREKMEQIQEIDIPLDDGRVLHAYDTASGPADTRTPIFWHHGTPNIGSPPAPLFAAAARHGMRWVSYDRPGNGGSSPNPGRNIASAAADVAAIADARGIGRFGVLGHSGGGPHALACAAILGDRVFAAVSASGMAPHPADAEDPAGLDERTWYADMYPGGTARLRAAHTGRAELETVLANDDFDPKMFTPADHAALNGDWEWLARVVGPALDNGPGGMIDDYLAYTGPWGFDPSVIAVPVLLLHGDADRMVPASHSEWLARHISGAELRISPGDGHISVLREAAAAVAWLGDQAASRLKDQVRTGGRVLGPQRVEIDEN